ncbi:UDP-galactose transporter senju [Chionoecetes opilio]|uniref:UDP-galactose transporter senju n=1 Tax=Chionoecetes opilio TaxID=41210 RepID=A0A8J5CNR2_CHIOP|nr:UDP-galactose transporter senju [Chionoecetes opilio]
MGASYAQYRQRWQVLFPTPYSFIIFIVYMALFINQGIMVTASQQADNSYRYNTVTVVLLTEVTKLVSLCHHLPEGVILGLYMVPALLYCLYNNLAFVNLAAFDPTTYFMLLQLRVVVTGIVFQLVFKKQLSRRQWVSLIILTVGCVIKQLSTTRRKLGVGDKPETGTEAGVLSNLSSVYTLLILVQIFCSCLAGVYNEKLLKDTGVEVPIMVQNIFMYIDSILCGVAVLAFRGEMQSAFTRFALSLVWKRSVVMVIINNAAVGIVTSLFLKNLNSILKTFASALELVFIAILSWIIFSIPIDLWTATAIALVTYATFMYAQSPVVNRGRLDEVEQGRPSDVELGEPLTKQQLSES